jgi:WhiB family redox-sensing transcriptional regulator
VSHYVYPDTTSRDSDWRDQALCRSGVHEPDLWFPTGSTGTALLQIEEAKAVCWRCPVTELCLQYATETRQEHGVWGGLSEDDRRKLVRRRNRKAAAERQKSASELYAEAYHAHTKPEQGGHLVWTGPAQMSVAGRHVSFTRLAFEVGTGTPPYGPVKASCDRYRCVAPEHLTDATVRAARKSVV